MRYGGNPDYAGQDFPLAIGEVYGFRSWGLSSDGELKAVAGPTVWKPGRNEAVCKREKYFPHSPKSFTYGPAGCPMGVRWNLTKKPKPHPEPAPVEACTCGFYAFHSPDNGTWSYMPIRGVIRGTGPTVIGTKGFRTHYAEVVAFVAPFALSGMGAAPAKALAQNWGVPFIENPFLAEEMFPGLKTYQRLDNF